MPDGTVALGPGGGSASEVEARRIAVAEALRWGEPAVVPHPGEKLAWAVPLMRNALLLGGLVATVPEWRAVGAQNRRRVVDVRAAGAALLRLAEEGNLTNAALLQQRRAESLRESDRAQALHGIKDRAHISLHAAYVREEPGLIAALRRGDVGEARVILNRLLVVIYHLGAGRLKLIKNFLLELVVTVARTAAESGAAPPDLLGTDAADLAELAAIDDEEALSRWLARTLNAALESIRANRRRPSAILLGQAMDWLEAHFAEKISRDDAAAANHLSPSHFSRLFKQRFGRPFGDVLNRLRCDRAADLLARTDKSLLQIGLESGFQDQSYFTKVFRRFTGMRPREYRLKKQGES